MPRIAVVPGDGIGVEVIEQGCRLLEAVAPDIELEHFDLGAERYLRDGTTLPDGAIVTVVARGQLADERWIGRRQIIGFVWIDWQPVWLAVKVVEFGASVRRDDELPTVADRDPRLQRLPRISQRLDVVRAVLRVNRIPGGNCGQVEQTDAGHLGKGRQAERVVHGWHQID